MDMSRGGIAGSSIGATYGGFLSHAAAGSNREWSTKVAKVAQVCGPEITDCCLVLYLISASRRKTGTAEIFSSWTAACSSTNPENC